MTGVSAKARRGASYDVARLAVAPHARRGYDAAGNLIADGAYTYTYNARGRLSRVSYGTSRTTYALNGLGQRVMKTGKGVSTGTNRFVYDEQGHLLGEYNSTAGMIQETVYLGDTPVAVLTPIATHYIHPDHLDTPRAITDTANKVVWCWDSDPFGATAANEDPDGDRKKFSYNLRFPGQYFDKETGLHYNYFRDYDPGTGRYVQSDPIGLLGGINTYTYVMSNPLWYSDPKGLAAQQPWGTQPCPACGGPSNGNVVPGFTLQNPGCDSFPNFLENRCVKKCCKEHDECYTKNRCNASSWIGNIFGAALACQRCNAAASRCVRANLSNSSSNSGNCSDCR